MPVGNRSRHRPRAVPARRRARRPAVVASPIQGATWPPARGRLPRLRAAEWPATVATPRNRFTSSSVASTRASRSAATTRAGAGAARSTRSATGRRRDVGTVRRAPVRARLSAPPQGLSTRRAVLDRGCVALAARWCRRSLLAVPVLKRVNACPNPHTAQVDLLRVRIPDDVIGLACAPGEHRQAAVAGDELMRDAGSGGPRDDLSGRHGVVLVAQAQCPAAGERNQDLLLGTVAVKRGAPCTRC